MVNSNCGKCGMLNHAGFCKLTACIYPCPTGMGGYINKPITNADRIRGMSDEELAELIRTHPWNKHGMVYADDSLIEWLKQEIE